MAGDTDKNGKVQSDQANPLRPPTVAGDAISVEVGEAARNVAAGKNIIQIGSLSLPRWAALLIVAALALIAVLVGVVAYFSQQTGASAQKTAAILAYTPTPSPTATPVPITTPTALPFAPAADGETMIVILPFHTTAATDSEVHKKIWRRIQELLKQKMPNEPVTAVIDPNTVLTADQQAEAEIVGRRYNASMVIWGEDTGVELIASFLNLREPDFAAADVDIEETQRTQLANPSEYAEFVTRELPGQLAFLALFAVGQAYYIDSNYLSAINTIEFAVAEVDSQNGQDTGDQATAISQGLVEAYFRLGWLYQHASVNLDTAIADYTRALALNPKYALAYNNRGAAYGDKGDLDQAIADYTQAITINPKYATVYYNRGVVYGAKGDLDQAIADYTKAISFDPTSTAAYNNRGAAYGDKGDLDQAIADYIKAISLDPKLAPAYNNRGLAYSDKGDLDQAIADFTKTISLAPQYALAYNSRATAYRDKGEYDLAIVDYNQAITLDPQDALVYNNRGLAYYDKGDLDHAFADYNRAIDLDPKHALAYTNRGNVYYTKGNLDQAIADYNQAIALDPKLALAYNNRGNAYSDKGNLDQAIADYTQAIRLDPTDTAAYYNRGIAYSDKGELDRAIADYTKAITVDAKYAAAHIGRGLAYHQKGELDQSISDYTKAISLDPKYAVTYIGRANVYKDKGDLDQAIADYTKAVTLDSKNADAYNALCWFLALQQKPQQAMVYCEEAVALAKNPYYLNSRGLAHALTGDFPAAITDFQVYADWLAANQPNETSLLEQRRNWIQSLRRGENPFTSDVLEELKKQS